MSRAVTREAAGSMSGHGVLDRCVSCVVARHERGTGKISTPAQPASNEFAADNGERALVAYGFPDDAPASLPGAVRTGSCG